MTWEREFFHLAATVLSCKLEDSNGHPDRFGCLLGELDYGREMHAVLKEAGMLPAQRLARCAGWLLQRGPVVRDRVRV
jgi:hypothetical protein